MTMKDLLECGAIFLVAAICCALFDLVRTPRPKRSLRRFIVTSIQSFVVACGARLFVTLLKDKGTAGALFHKTAILLSFLAIFAMWVLAIVLIVKRISRKI